MTTTELFARADGILHDRVPTNKLVQMVPTLLRAIGEVWCTELNPVVQCVIMPISRGPYSFGKLHISIRASDSRFLQIENIAYWWTRNVLAQLAVPPQDTIANSKMMRVLIAALLIERIYSDPRITLTYLGWTTNFARLEDADEHDRMMVYAASAFSRVPNCWANPLPWNLPYVDEILPTLNLNENQQTDLARAMAAEVSVAAAMMFNGQVASE